MRRRPFVVCTALAAVLAAAPESLVAAESTAAGAARPPNVIIYLVDTLRADHLGLYGYPRATSPRLDRWATGGVTFDRAYAPSSWTRPSMVSLLSGLDPISHGVEDRLDTIPADVRLLSEHLRSSGYATFAAVTNPNVLPVWGFGRGFDVYEDLDADGRHTRADAVSDWIVERIPELARQQPFLLYVHVVDPHAPYDPPAPFDTRFPRSPALPAEQSIGRYDGEVAFVDAQLGRVVDALTEHALDADTLMIFVADHGEELLDHGNLGHGANLFEEVVRVPLVIRFPKGAHAGRRVGTPVSLIDVLPTVLSVAGQPEAAGLDGRDLTALLDGGAPCWASRELYLALGLTGEPSNGMRGVLQGPIKYLRRWSPTASEALFDLAQDPHETKSVLDVETKARARSAAALDAYVARKSSGVHLRIVNDTAADPVDFEAVLHTTGRFTDVSAIGLEAGDRFEISDDGEMLRLKSRLLNRRTPKGDTRPPLPDEDGLVFRVTRPSAPIVVERVGRTDDRALPLRAGPLRQRQPVPFTFETTAPEWSARNVGELPCQPGSQPGRSTPTAYLAVVPSPIVVEGLSPDVSERLRALGYLTGPTAAE